MRQLLLIPFLFFLFCLNGYNQKKEIPLRDYFNDAEFFFAEEEYVDALQDYMVVYNQGYKENANINYRIGICYLNIPGQKEKSIDYLLVATQNVSAKYSGLYMKEEFAPLDAFLYLGNAYRIDNQMEKAKESYSKYVEMLPEVAVVEKRYAEKQIESCDLAMTFMANPLPIKFTNLGSIINTNGSNHNCVVSGDGSTLIYMTKLPFYEAVFMSKRRGNNWSRPTNITPQIMSDGDQYVTGISYNGNTILLIKEDEFDSDIYISNFENGQWNKSKPLSKNVNSRFWESHASMSKDGKTIYFSSNKTGGLGMSDIYVTEQQEDGSWSAPKNLGNVVNTNLGDDTPFISEDGMSLYFSSQGHNNIGGFDYFVSHKNDTGWSTPENLNYPLSTTDEDIFYYPYNNGELAYVHKILDDGLGSFDIYLVGPADDGAMEELITDQVIEEVEEDEEVETKYLEFDIRPVHFDFDKHGLTAKAKNELNEYVGLLKKYSELKLKLVGHTDAIGSDAYNQKLSERRANSVVTYLKSQGIEGSRLESDGKGEKEFIAINTNPDGTDNPEGRKYNRRVDIMVIDMRDDSIIFKKINPVPLPLRIGKK
jgi:outer membrane protein OmpA-like peptidoglycan-associated protein